MTRSSNAMRFMMAPHNCSGEQRLKVEGARNLRIDKGPDVDQPTLVARQPPVNAEAWLSSESDASCPILGIALFVAT
jgi:hypothetical protein